MKKELILSKEQAAEFYKEHAGKDYFDSLCTHMSRYKGVGWSVRDLCGANPKKICKGGGGGEGGREGQGVNIFMAN